MRTPNSFAIAAALIDVLQYTPADDSNKLDQFLYLQSRNLTAVKRSVESGILHHGENNPSPCDNTRRSTPRERFLNAVLELVEVELPPLEKRDGTFTEVRRLAEDGSLLVQTKEGIKYTFHLPRIVDEYHVCGYYWVNPAHILAAWGEMKCSDV